VGGADVVREWGIGFFCLQPSYVALAAGALRESGARVVSVVGFPHGGDRSTVKALAAELAVRDGAAEVDMVMNVGRFKAGRTQAVADEIAQVVRAIPGIPLKVILETCLLTDEEKVLACRLVRTPARRSSRPPPGSIRPVARRWPMSACSGEWSGRISA
jgi:deoxyribose-phosphate aldolase